MSADCCENPAGLGEENPDLPDLSFQRGLKDGLPICLGYISVSFAFGMTVAQSGMPIWAALFISATNVTSAGQFAGFVLILHGAKYLEIAITTLVINLRYFLMSLSLSQKVERGFIRVVDDVEHFIHHILPEILGMRVVDRMIRGKAGKPERFFDPQAVKLDPDILPGQFNIRPVGTDLLGKQHKAFSTFDVVFRRFAIALFCRKDPGAGNDIVKQIVILGDRTKCVCRCTLFPAVLIHDKINKIFVWKY